jgi:Tfp pilus assembly protein PilF
MLLGLKRYWPAALAVSLVSVCLNTRALALDKRASFALSHYIMGGIYAGRAETDQAIQEYRKALKADYESLEIHLSLAASYIKKKDTPKAIEELKIAAGLHPEAVEPRAILALLYATQNKTSLAAQEYESALRNAAKLEPKNIEIYKDLGEFYLQGKNYKEAEAAYRLALEISPDDREAHFFLAHIYDENKDIEGAIRELKKAVEISPDYHQALNYLGYLYAQKGANLAQAEAMVKKALEFEPDNGAYVDSLGWVYFKQGKLKEALRELERADSLIQDPEVTAHLEEVRKKLDAARQR